MNQTHTPLIIEGKIYVVVDAPDAPSPLDIHFERKKRIYYSILSTCTKYETLQQDAPYWKERIGQRVEVEIKELQSSGVMKGVEKRFTKYAIPPQQKQGDDLWEEVYRVIVLSGMKHAGELFNYMQKNYSITKK